MKATYTHLDLMESRRQYRYNYEKLLAAVGTPDHDKYAAEEHRLNALQDKIMRALQIGFDPCPIRAPYSCDKCTGYYIRRAGRGMNIYRGCKCNSDAVGARRCDFIEKDEDEE